MSILESELLMLKSLVVSDAGANGGRMDNNTSVTSGVANNVWPSVFAAERAAGSTKYRKTFFKVANDDDETLYNPMIWMNITTPGDDWVTFYEGSQIDTQAGITGTDAYGCSQLNTNVVIGASQVIVDVADASLSTGAYPIFRVGDTIRITNKDTPSSGTGTEEIHVLTTATPAGTQWTLVFSATTLAYDYNTNDNTYGTRVMAVYEPASIIGSFDNWDEAGMVGGSYDEGSYPPICDNIGTIDQEITLTFSDASNFIAASNVSGITLTGGNVTSDWIPDNPDVSKPYVTLEFEGWSGTATGDVLVFEVHPASEAIWQKRVVPAACGSLTGNRAVAVLSGEAV